MAIYIGYPYAGDELTGGTGNDSLYGDSGNDTLTGGKDNDTLTGGADSDTFVFANNDGKDLITDYTEEDVIKFTSGTPKFKKSGSNVLITLGNGKITVKGAADKVITYIDKDGNERTYPKIVNESGKTLTLLENYNKDSFDVADYDGDDGATYKTIDASAVESALTITGNKLANKITGSQDDDYIDGGAGADLIDGGKGSNTILGGKGNDTLTGGDGTNVFLYRNGDGNDVITDYKNGDTIKLLSGSVKNASVNKNNDYVLTIGNGTITVKGAAEKYLRVVDANDNETWYPEPPPAPAVIARKSITLTEGFFDDSMNINTYTEAANFKSTIVTIDASAVQHDMTLVGNKLANLITGTDQDDIIDGGAGKDTIDAGAGNDSLNGGTGNDSLIGGKGNDTLTGGSGADIFVYNKGDGNDIITDYTDDDKIVINNDTVTKITKGKSNVVFTLASNKKITIQGGADKIISYSDTKNPDGTTYPEPINDPIEYNSKGTAVSIHSNYTEDTFEPSDYSAYPNLTTIDASDANDIIILGNKKANNIIGSVGNDSLNGGAGNDTLAGGKGNDSLTGGKGADVFVYNKGDGNDVITDYANDDMLVINNDYVKGIKKSGGNVIFTLASKNKITIQGGTDKIISYSDAENPGGTTYPEIDSVVYNSKGTAATLNFNYEEDGFAPSDYSEYSDLATIDASAVIHTLTVTGNKKANYILGSSEADYINGASGNDTIYGNDGDDTLLGGDGNDKIYGGDGQDSLWGGAGSDTLWGGDGDDTFVYTKNDGKVTIADYEDIDTIMVLSGKVGTIRSNTTDVTFEIGSGQLIVKNAANKYVELIDGSGNTVKTYRPK